MTTDVLAAARRRLELLRTEVRQLEAFIEMGDRIARGDHGPIDSTALGDSGTVPAGRGAGPSPRDVVRATYDMLSGSGAILSKEALLEGLGERGLVMTRANPAKNLGTIMWRNRELFEHVRGRGYRLTGAPHTDDAGGSA